MWKILILALVCSRILVAAETTTSPIPNVPSFEILSRITCDINGYNLGDNLMSYIRAKWLSIHYNIPLLYKPFPFANLFGLHEIEKKKFHPAYLEKFKTVHAIQNELEICFEDPSETLYVVPCYQEPELGLDNSTPFIEIDWTRKDFRKLIKKLLKPIDAKATIAIPSQRISVAVYMPQYTGDANCNEKSALQMPPDSYYIEQIAKISELFYHRPLYVYLFTENRNPAEVLEKFRRKVNGHNILFECKQSPKVSRDSFVQDFLNMSRFDCLVRPLNNMGYLLEQLNDYLITMTPSHYEKVNGKVRIDAVSIRTSEKLRK